jgi:hypothetical protein
LIRHRPAMYYKVNARYVSKERWLDTSLFAVSEGRTYNSIVY